MLTVDTNAADDKLVPEMVRPDLLVVDVLGVRRDAVRRPAHAPGEVGEPCGGAREVSVGMVHAGSPHLVPEHRRLQQVPQAREPRRPEADPGRPQPAPRIRPQDAGQRAQDSRRLAERSMRQVDDTCAHLLEECVAEGLIGPAHREDRHPLALALELDDLGGDERLRDAWEALEDVTEVAGLPTHWTASATASRRELALGRGRPRRRLGLPRSRASSRRCVGCPCGPRRGPGLRGPDQSRPPGASRGPSWMASVRRAAVSDPGSTTCSRPRAAKARALMSCSMRGRVLGTQTTGVPLDKASSSVL